MQLSMTILLLRIACGGPNAIDANQALWQSDTGFVGGANFGPAQLPEMADQPAPYQSLRYTTGQRITYVFHSQWLADTIVLKFLEPRYWQVKGGRVFDVYVQGKLVLPRLDIFDKAGGFLKPVDFMFPVTAGEVTVTLVPLVGNAMISAIQLQAVGPKPECPCK